MTPKLFQANGDTIIQMTAEELRDLVSGVVKEALKDQHSVCVAFSEEERSLLRDLITGAGALKKAIIWAVVVAILVGIGVKYLPSISIVK